MVSTTRPMSCLTLRSRSGVPIWPRKYFETTMLVACCDQKLGISTSRCSKTTSPRSLPMTAARSSHSTSSNGSTPGLGEEARERQPGRRSGRLRSLDASAALDARIAPGRATAATLSTGLLAGTRGLVGSAFLHVSRSVRLRGICPGIVDDRNSRPGERTTLVALAWKIVLAASRPVSNRV